MIAIWVFIWQMIYYAVGKAILIPSPFNTFKACLRLFADIEFYSHVAFTLYRVTIGVAISLFIGMISAVISSLNEMIRDFLKPFIIILKSTPVIGIIILALLWFNSNQMPIFVCFLMCYPVIYTNILAGFLNVDKQLLEMAEVYKVKRSSIIKNIYLPHTMPYLVSATSLATGLAFKVVIAAEVIAVPKYSMGYHLLKAKSFLEIEELFAWLIIIIYLSGIWEKGVHYLLVHKRRQML